MKMVFVNVIVERELATLAVRPIKAGIRDQVSGARGQGKTKN